MKIPDIDVATLDAARNGSSQALDSLLVQIQPGVYNLCVRMLGNRDDAKDACQEILIKVITHLSTFRGESAWSTWVFRVAKNYLITASTRQRESPETSFADIDTKLASGLQLGESSWSGQSVSPEDKLAARQMAIGCTQGMLMCLDREHRLAYILDVVFGLASEVAGEVLGITAAAYRKRLSRARQSLDVFTQRSCGLVNSNAACKCDRQVHAIKVQAGSLLANTRSVSTADDAARTFDQLVMFSDAAAVFRSQPSYATPENVIQTIRAVLTVNGYLGDVDHRSLPPH